MGFVADTPRGQRARDASINLVPYVDVLMTLMAFLVMCAAWTALGAIDARMSGGASEGTPGPTLTIELRSNAAPELSKMASFIAANPTAALEVMVEDGVAFEHVAVVLDRAKGLGYPPPSLQPM